MKPLKVKGRNKHVSLLVPEDVGAILDLIKLEIYLGDRVSWWIDVYQMVDGVSTRIGAFPKEEAGAVEDEFEDTYDSFVAWVRDGCVRQRGVG